MTAPTPPAPIARPFSDVYLVAYSDEHLLYECDMFFWLANTLGGGARLGASNQSDTTRMSNVLIEGFAVHLRNVIDFLYLDNPKKTDIVAADFCAAGVWAKMRHAEPGRLGPRVERLIR